MKHIFCLSFLFLLAAILPGCKKSGGSGNGNATVYIAGFDNGDIVYWKNGVDVFLETADPGFYGNSTGIAVLNGDVYVTGYVGDTAIVWKNGVETTLSDPTFGSAVASAITTSGTDVYIAGYGEASSGNNVLYWKNGVKTVVATNSNLIDAASIAVSGTDVYVAATIGNDTAAYWKDGVRVTLGSHYSYAYGIALSGSDVYVVGADNGAPVYWKNGTETVLTHTGSTGSAGATSITVSGADVYITGLDNGNAVYWKNGSEKVLGAGIANAIAVSGSDVYVTGSSYAVSSQTNYAASWKNGSLTTYAASPPATLATEEGNAIVVTSP